MLSQDVVATRACAGERGAAVTVRKRAKPCKQSVSEGKQMDAEVFLPVLARQLGMSAEQLRIDIRFALHRLRQAEGGEAAYSDAQAPSPEEMIAILASEVLRTGNSDSF